MAFHQQVQTILMTGVRRHAAERPAPAAVPPALAGLVAAVAPAHAECNARAIAAGNRYRSAFWIIYLLSALAVLCAVLPLALGWDDQRHDMHAMAGFWAVAEVAVICFLGLTYWRGHHGDWQGQWLAERTLAELTWYLPLVAPLLDHTQAGDSNWYRRLFGEAAHMPAGEAIDSVCERIDPLARGALAGCWDDPVFVAGYANWAVAQLDGQRYYHQGVVARQEGLSHRVHRINAWLFGLTLLGALAHLRLHTMWLSLVTIVFPALGASLHGALAQSESYRLAATSRRLAKELAAAVAAIRAADGQPALRAAIGAAIMLILDEHRDWHMLVRPHHLPLG
jgi:hypothetical protein